MTKFILLRHGEPAYDEVVKLGFKGTGLALAPLTPKGISDVQETAENKIFENSDILISSPYTRTMQTASIIAKRHNLDIKVEPLLHEWIPDLSNNYNTEEEFLELIRTAKCDWELKKQNHNHICSSKTEALDHVQERAIEALSKYLDYNKVIVVSHGLLISTLFKEKVKIQTAGLIIVTDSEINENLKQIGMRKTLCKK